MSRRSDIPTLKVTPAPVVLVVGCPPKLVKSCREAAISGQAFLVEADVASAATLAAQTRPLVLIVYEDVYSFDARSFNDLASDVRAQLVLVDDAKTDGEIRNLVMGAMLEAEASRDSFASL